MSEVFNYVDFLSTSSNFQFMADQHDRAIETNGRKAYIFKLDKEATELSDVYQEELHGRVYLPHFAQRALYKTNTFVSMLNASNYTEKEENLDMEFDFGRMVHNIHELKSTTAGILTIKNIYKVPLVIEINNDNFIIRKHQEVLFSKEVKGNIFEFVNKINSETGLVFLSYSGDGESIEFLERMQFSLLPRREQKIELNNSIYKNTTDVISRGDIIVNDKMRVYQVVGAYPKDDSYGQYITWKVQLELTNLAKVDGLPNDYSELVKNNQYNLGKVEL